MSTCTVILDFIRGHYMYCFCLLAFGYQVNLLYHEYHHGISVIISIDAAEPSNLPAVSLWGPLQRYRDEKNVTHTCSSLQPLAGPFKYHDRCPWLWKPAAERPQVDHYNEYPAFIAAPQFLQPNLWS